MMRKAFFLLALMLVFSNASALDWTVPNEITENSNWSFYANLSGETFDEVQVFLGGDKVYEELTWGDNFTDYSKVVYANIDPQKKLVVSFAGLNSGEYDLELRIFKEGSEQNSLNTEISVFVPGAREDIQEVKENFSATRTELDRLDEKIAEMDSFNESIAELKNDLSNIESKISSGESSVSELQLSLSDVSVKLSSLTSKTSNQDASLKASVDELSTQTSNLQATLDEMTKEEPIFTGFVSFVQGEPVIALGFIGVIAAVIIYMVLRKRKSDSGTLFDTGFDGSSNSESGESPEAHEIDLGEDESDPNARKGGGRWAFGENFAAESKEQEKGFSVTDLLWKK